MNKEKNNGNSAGIFREKIGFLNIKVSELCR